MSSEYRKAEEGERSCSVCDRLHVARGFCALHYKYWRLKNNINGAAEKHRNYVRENRHKWRRKPPSGNPRGWNFRAGSVDRGKRPLKNRLCRVDGCGQKHKALGLCVKHYWQHRAALPQVIERRKKYFKGRYQRSRLSASQRESAARRQRLARIKDPERFRRCERNYKNSVRGKALQYGLPVDTSAEIVGFFDAVKLFKKEIRNVRNERK